MAVQQSCNNTASASRIVPTGATPADSEKRLAKQNNHGGVERKLPCYPEIFGASTAVQLWQLLVAAHVTEDMDDDTRFARVTLL